MTLTHVFGAGDHRTGLPMTGLAMTGMRARPNDAAGRTVWA